MIPPFSLERVRERGQPLGAVVLAAVLLTIWVTWVHHVSRELLRHAGQLREHEGRLRDHETRHSQAALVLTSHGGRLTEVEAKAEAVSEALVAHRGREGQR